LVVKNKASLIAAFFPACFLPLFITAAYSLLGLLAAIGLQTDPEGVDYDSALLLSINLVPFLFGLVASAVPASLAMLGRLYLELGGLPKLAKKEGKDGESGFDPKAWANKEAEDYVEQLVRPR
ncbi:MAG: hypothetical protein AAFV88_23160, partial [Planctomycetota bacterium]